MRPFRRLLGVVMGIVLVFPGAAFVQWLSEALGVYPDMTLTEALLVILIVVGCALIFGQSPAPMTAEQLEKQAERMELASRRLEAAQRRLRNARRTLGRSALERRDARPRPPRTRP